MARNNDARGLSWLDADLTTRCVPIAKLLYRRNEPKDPFVRNIVISSYCFSEQEIYQTKEVSVTLALELSGLEQTTFTFALFNRGVLAHDGLTPSSATDAWEVQGIHTKSEWGGSSCSSSIDRRDAQALFQSVPDLPLLVFPELPIVGTVDVLHGDFSGGYGLQVNFDPEKARKRSEPTTIVRSFSFSNFSQYRVAQLLAVGFRELCCAQAKFDKAWKEFGGKLPQPTTAE